MLNAGKEKTSFPAYFLPRHGNQFGTRKVWNPIEFGHGQDQIDIHDFERFKPCLSISRVWLGHARNRLARAAERVAETRPRSPISKQHNQTSSIKLQRRVISTGNRAKPNSLKVPPANISGRWSGSKPIDATLRASTPRAVVPSSRANQLPRHE